MSERICSVPDCGNPSRARGWCTKHYQRWRKNGAPEVAKLIVGDDVARLWSKVDRRDDGGCWPWTGYCTPQGYGRFSYAGEPRPAHRVAYELMVGLIPDGMVLDHMCHDPDSCAGGDTCPHRRCCNPKHLVVTTTEQNTSAVRTHHVNRYKTHCERGHEFTPENTYVQPAGTRQCRECRKSIDRKRQARRKSAKRDLAKDKAAAAARRGT